MKAPIARMLPVDAARFRTFPAWSLIGIGVGWGVATYLIPESGFHAIGALRPAALALAAGLLFGPGIAVMRSPSAAFRVEHMLVLGLIFWILFDGIQAAYDLWNTSYEGVQRAFAGVALFGTGIWLGSATASALRPPSAASDPPGSDLRVNFLFAIACVCILIGTLRVALPCELDVDCMLESLTVKRGTAGAFHRYVFGAWSNFFHHLRFLTFVLPAIAVAVLYLERRWTWRVWLCAGFAVFSVLVLIGDGGRRAVGVSAGAALLVWVLLDERVRLKHLLGAAALFSVLLYVMQAMVAYRESGFLTGFGEARPLEVKGRQGVLVVDKNLFYLSYLTTLVPERHEYQLQRGVSFYASLPVPRALWPGKPVDYGINLPRHLGWNVPDNFSVTISAVGNFYLMGGFVAVLFGGALYGALANACGRLLNRPPTIRNRILFAIGAMTLFVAMRSLHELIVTGYLVLAFSLFIAARRLWAGFLRREAGLIPGARRPETRGAGHPRV